MRALLFCAKAVEGLEAVRLAVQDKLGLIPLLAERPGKRMAKHKSRALSVTLSQRFGSYCSFPSAHQKTCAPALLHAELAPSAPYIYPL